MENSSTSTKSLSGNANENNLNNIGWTFTGQPDEHLQQFIQFAVTAEGPILDLGCASGHNTKLLLNAGVKSIIANDINEDGLKALFQSLTNEETERAVALRGNTLTLNKILKPGTVSGILAGNLLHFFTTHEIRGAFRLFFDLLVPKGWLYVTTFSTQCGPAQDLLPSAPEQHQFDGEWPGKVGNNSAQNISEKSIYKVFLDPETLEREAVMAGFIVEKCEFVTRNDFPSWFQINDQPGKSASLIAIKPATTD